MTLCGCDPHTTLGTGFIDLVFCLFVSRQRRTNEKNERRPQGSAAGLPDIATSSKSEELKILQ